MNEKNHVLITNQSFTKQTNTTFKKKHRSNWIIILCLLFSLICTCCKFFFSCMDCVNNVASHGATYHYDYTETQYCWTNLKYGLISKINVSTVLGLDKCSLQKLFVEKMERIYFKYRACTRQSSESTKYSHESYPGRTLRTP
jgi:hypothetical protein